MATRPGGSRRRTSHSVPRRSGTVSSARHSVASVAWQRAILPVVVVAVVVAGSLLAHAKVPSTAEVTGNSAVMLTRTLSCVRDAHGSSARIGTVPPGTAGVTASGSRVSFAPGVAADGYAVQWASGKSHRATWIAARSCPSLGDDWWFVGVGSSKQHDTVLTLDNPQPVDATFALTVYGPQGQVVVPGAGSFLVHAGTSQSWDLGTLAPTRDGDIAVRINVTRGLVAASMWETWARTPLYAPTHQWVPAVASPSRRLQLMTVPGAVAPGSTLLVTNPGSSNAVVQVKAVNPDATFAPAKFSVLNVPPGETLSVPFGDLRKVSINSLILTSNIRVSAMLRSVSGSAEAYAVPAQRIGAESTAGLPAGMPATLNLTASTTAEVGVQAVDAHGNVVLTKSVQVLAGKATTVALPKAAAALRLTSDRHSNAMAAISLGGAGIAMIGMAPTANAARVPAVIPQAY